MENIPKSNKSKFNSKKAGIAFPFPFCVLPATIAIIHDNYTKQDDSAELIPKIKPEIDMYDLSQQPIRVI